MSYLTAKVHPLVERVIQDKNLIFQARQLHEGPVHLLFPELMDENIARFREAFAEIGVRSSIYFAHKASPSPSFIKQAVKNNIGIEVASSAELISALAGGCPGHKVLVAGIKQPELLSLAIAHNCLVSIDALWELEKVIELHQIQSSVHRLRLLIRLADPVSKDRHTLSRLSRFGVPETDLPVLYAYLKEHPQRFSLEGFHVHYYESNVDTYAGFVDHMLRLIEQAHKEGFSPTVIDIGGSFRTSTLQDPQQGNQFIEELEHAIVTQQPTGTWRNYTYGLSLNERDRISGREKLQAKFTNIDLTERLKIMLGNEELRGRALSTLIEENGFSVIVEPGLSLLYQCGITLLSVAGIKRAANGELLIITEGNIYNFSYGAFELFLDPVLISREEDQQPCSAYIVGNTCKEEDFILARKISFSSTPKPGDQLCFINTAAYVSGFVDASPHMHPRGAKFVCVEKDNQRRLMKETLYNPYLQK